MTPAVSEDKSAFVWSGTPLEMRCPGPAFSLLLCKFAEGLGNGVLEFRGTNNFLSKDLQCAAKCGRIKSIFDHISSQIRCERFYAATVNCLRYGQSSVAVFGSERLLAFGARVR